MNKFIPILHRLVTSEHGENYWFNGCAAYVMECLGEKDYDYQFFAGITGDVFVQHYRQPFMGDGVNAYHQVGGDLGFFCEVFAKCGYSADFVPIRSLLRNKTGSLQMLRDYIEKGVPVISLGMFWPPCSVFVGYEADGETLFYISGDNDVPQPISWDKAVESSQPDLDGWIFVGKKNEERDLAGIYREAIYALPDLLAADNEDHCFGPAAFYRWADDIQKGYFDRITPETFDIWPMYTNFICVLATNGSCCHEFLRRAKALNPDMGYLDEISRLYKRTADIWSNDNGKDLEALGGGFNVTLQTLQAPEQREKIAARIRECGDLAETIRKILIKHTKGAL